MEYWISYSSETPSATHVICWVESPVQVSPPFGVESVTGTLMVNIPSLWSDVLVLFASATRILQVVDSTSGTVHKNCPFVER